jgi:hypothetical protein
MAKEVSSDRRRILAIKSPTANFDLYDAGKHSSAYADGISNVSLGMAVSKIEFFKVVSVSDSDGPDLPKLHEDRELVAQLTVPTTALIEAFVSTLQNLWPQREQFFASFEAQKQTLEKMVDSMQNIGKLDV